MAIAAQLKRASTDEAAEPGSHQSTRMMPRQGFDVWPTMGSARLGNEFAQSETAITSVIDHHSRFQSRTGIFILPHREKLPSSVHYSVDVDRAALLSQLGQSPISNRQVQTRRYAIRYFSTRSTADLVWLIDQLPSLADLEAVHDIESILIKSGKAGLAAIRMALPRDLSSDQLLTLLVALRWAAIPQDLAQEVHALVAPHLNSACSDIRAESVRVLSKLAVPESRASLEGLKECETDPDVLEALNEEAV